METAREAFRNGRWRLCDRSSWPDDPSHLNIMALCWELGYDSRGRILHWKVFGFALATNCFVNPFSRPWRIA
jgi:hypothetical protein